MGKYHAWRSPLAWTLQHSLIFGKVFDSATMPRCPSASRAPHPARREKERGRALSDFLLITQTSGDADTPSAQELHHFSNVVEVCLDTEFATPLSVGQRAFHKRSIQ